MSIEQKREEMLTAPIEKIICSMAIPTILGMLMMAFYNMTDTFFVGMLHKVELTAAVGIIFSFLSMVQAVGFLFGYGSGNYMARKLGKGRQHDAEIMAATGFVFSVVTGIIIMILGYLLTDSLVGLLGGSATEGLKQSCLEMLWVFLAGVPAMTGSLCLYNQLRLEGNAGKAILGMGTGMILNMLLDPILILGLHMGIQGAALATVIGQYVGIVTLLYIIKKGDYVQIKLCKLTLQGDIIKELFFGGMPNFLRQFITTIMGILLNHIAGRYGSETIAAFTITNRIIAMMTMGVIGFGQGFQSVCAYNYGAGLIERVKKGFEFCVKVTTCILLLIAGIGFLNAEVLVNVFTDDKIVIENGLKILRFSCIAIPFMGYTTMKGMLLQNIGKFGKATLVTSLRQGILFPVFVLALPLLWGIEGVMWAQPIADIAAFCVVLGMAHKEERAESKKSCHVR